MRLTQVLICTSVLLLLCDPAGYTLANSDAQPSDASKQIDGAKPSDSTEPAAGSRLPLPPIDDGSDSKTMLNPGPLIEPKFPNLSSPSSIIRLEAKFNQGITLRDALMCTMNYNLPIRIARESWKYQRYQLFSNLAGFVPSFSTGYNRTTSDIRPNIDSRAKVFTAEVDFPVFEGGSIFFNSLAQYYRDRGWKRSYEVSVNDALLDTYNKYTDLVLQNALLRIRAKSLRLSEYDLQLNTAMYEAGVGTLFNVMQCRTQVGLDRTSYMEQESNTRQAALQLAYALNLPLSGNLIPVDSILQEIALVNSSLGVVDLINIAFNNRPDLRQYELFRLAAARTVQASAAPLYPQLSFFTDFTHANTSTSQGGVSSSTSSSNSLNSAGIFPGNTKTIQVGMNLTWTLSNMGLLNTANIMSARALSRQAMLQANQSLQQVDSEIRAGYLNFETSKQRAGDAASSAWSAKEALKFSHVRLRSGVGTNLETIQAQRDYITALTTQARAITTSNQSQASLLHAAGVISVDTLTDGFHGGKEAPARTK